MDVMTRAVSTTGHLKEITKLLSEATPFSRRYLAAPDCETMLLGYCATAGDLILDLCQDSFPP
eukprot:5803235-Pyramimonas_sp.AAC.1